MRRAGARLYAWYDSHLRATPLRTKAVTAGAVSLCGDGIAQSLERRHGSDGEAAAEAPPHDAARSLRQVCYSFCFTPLVHGWYGVLQRSALPVLGRVGADQLLFSPFAHVAFFTYMPLAKGGGAPEVEAELRGKLAVAMTANYALWPAAQVLNFKLVPARYQVFFVNLVSLFYSVFLSGLAQTSATSLGDAAGGDAALTERQCQITPCDTPS